MKFPILCDWETADLSCSCSKMSARMSEQSFEVYWGGKRGVKSDEV